VRAGLIAQSRWVLTSLHISCIDELYGFGTGCSVFIARDDVKAGAFLRLKVVMKSIDA
jgi:hypothetical protein